MRAHLLPIALSLMLPAACAGGPEPRPESGPESGAAPAASSGAASEEGPAAGGPTPSEQQAVTDLRMALGRALSIEDPQARIEALEEIRHALPPDTGARAFVANALVHAYGEVGDLDGMQEVARDVPVQESLETAQMLNAMAYAYAEADTRLTEGWVRIQQALQIVERLTESVPKEQLNEPAVQALRAAFLDTLGWLQFRMGDLPAALTTLEQALTEADDWEIRYHRGRVLQGLGRTDEAARDYARAVAAGGDDAEPAREALDALPGVDAEALIERARRKLAGERPGPA